MARPKRDLETQTTYGLQPWQRGNWVRPRRPKRDLEAQKKTKALKLDGDDSTLSGAYTLQALSSSVGCEARTRGNGVVLRATSTFSLV